MLFFTSISTTWLMNNPKTYKPKIERIILVCITPFKNMYNRSMQERPMSKSANYT